MDADISHFDQEHEGVVIKQLEVLLSLQPEDKIVVRNVFPEHGTGQLVLIMTFYLLILINVAMLISLESYRSIVFIMNFVFQPCCVVLCHYEGW